MSPIRSSKTDRARQSLRLDAELWEMIDASRSGRPGSVSRNTWIAEAIMEKLAAEQDNNAAKRSRALHA
jgi:metal-responsive CopG/Arc/MetJ family transcriptional regulator